MSENKEKIPSFDEWLNEDFENPFADDKEKKEKKVGLVQDKGGMLKKRREGHRINGIEYEKKPGRGHIVKAKHNFPKGETVEICPVVILSDQTKNASKVLNTMLFELGEGKWALVLGYGSLYKHADEPNLDYAYDKQKKKMHFITRKAIQPGEELTINYGIDHTNKDEDFGTIAGINTKRSDDNQGMPNVSQENEGQMVQPGEADDDYNFQDRGQFNDPQSRFNPAYTGRAIKGTSQQ